MKSRFLLPTQFKVFGIVTLIPSLVLGILTQTQDFGIPFLTFNIPRYLKFEGFYNFSNGDSVSYVLNKVNFTNELSFTGIILSLFFIGFSKLKEEDEYISKVRLDSLQMSLYLNFGFLLLASYFVHGYVFLYVPLFNIFTPLIIFIMLFHYQIYVKPLMFQKNEN